MEEEKDKKKRKIVGTVRGTPIYSDNPNVESMEEMLARRKAEKEAQELMEAVKRTYEKRRK